MTAEELYNINFNGLHYDDVTPEMIQKYAIEFAQYHVKKALENALEEVPYGGSDEVRYEDGDSIDLSWEQVKTRCEKLGVNHVPELEKYYYDSEEFKFFSNKTHLNNLVEAHTDNMSKEFPNHIREGVCIRVENGSLTPLILKNKSLTFKVLEGIIKDTDVVDIEESN